MRTIRNLVNRTCIVLGTAAVTMLSACDMFQSSDHNNNGAIRAPLSALALVQPQSCSAYRDYVTASLVKRFTSIPEYIYYGCNKGGIGVIEPLPGQPVPATDSTTTVGSGGGAGALPPTSGPDDVTQTNNQEAGVNESDMVKVDKDTGTVFIGHSKYLLIADAFPPQNMSIIKQIDMGAQVIDLLYDDPNKRLVVITRYQSPIIYFDTLAPVAGAPVTTIDGIIAPVPIKPETMVTFLDVSGTIAPVQPNVTPPDPVLLQQLNIEGSYQTSRRIDSRVHMVTRHYMTPDVLTSDPEFQQLNAAFQNALAAASCDVAGGAVPPDAIANNPGVVVARQNLTDKIVGTVASMDIGEFIPKAKSGIGAEQTDIPDYLACTDIYHPTVNTSLGMQVVSSVDSDGSNVGAASIMNNAWLTYVSQDSLFISETSNWWWWGDPATVEQTAIHKFSISDQRPQYLATGVVDGHANNSFNFSEHKGFLRVATNQTVFTPATPTSPWQRVVKNHLSILADDNAGTLEITGEVRDLALGETIRSARFLGDKGFIVTFRSIDPLFSFDLSDPTNPQLMGELEIPGFSTYMHPYDENHLLTIGRSGGANGTGTGNAFQLQLIDISDLSNPTVVEGSQYQPVLPAGYSWSSAMYDHHAFTFYKPADLLIIPAQVWSRDPTQVFSGMLALRVSLDAIHKKGSITLIDRVDHADLAQRFYCDPTTGIAAPDYQWACATDSNYYMYWASPRRSIVMTHNQNNGLIDAYMYTISDVGMKAGLIADSYTPISDVLFPPQVYPWYVVNAVDSTTGGTGGVRAQ